jgi:hypothetical protein
MSKSQWRVETVETAALAALLAELEEASFEIYQVTPVREGEQFTIIARKAAPSKKGIGF